MKIVFMGTSIFAVPSLMNLIKSDHEIVGVISQPDRPRGRGRKLAPTPVKELADSYNLQVYQPSSIKAPEAVAHVRAWNPQLIVVVSYGQIIPPDILNYPDYGCINVHASLLPKYRGAAPIQRALMDGENITGISIMFMDKGLDTGDIIMQDRITIEDNIDHGQLEKILAERGADLLLKTISLFKEGKSVPRIQQDHSQASYAGRLSAQDEAIDWSNSALFIHNQIRALSPQPGAFSYFDGSKLKIYRSRIANARGSGVIAKVIEISQDGFVVQTGDGMLEILEVQKEGKKRMLSSDFLKGCKLTSGVFMGTGGG